MSDTLCGWHHQGITWQDRLHVEISPQYQPGSMAGDTGVSYSLTVSPSQPRWKLPRIAPNTSVLAARLTIWQHLQYLIKTEPCTIRVYLYHSAELSNKICRTERSGNGNHPAKLLADDPTGDPDPNLWVSFRSKCGCFHVYTSFSAAILSLSIDRSKVPFFDIHGRWWAMELSLPNPPQRASHPSGTSSSIDMSPDVRYPSHSARYYIN